MNPIISENAVTMCTKDELLAQLASQEAELVSLRSFKKETESIQDLKCQLIAKYELLLSYYQELTEKQDGVLSVNSEVIALHRELLGKNERVIQLQQEVGRLSADRLKIILECSVCKELPEKAVLLDCSHTFCRGCIEKWLDGGEDGCPMCRRTVYSLKKNLMVSEAVNFMVKHQQLP